MKERPKERHIFERAHPGMTLTGFLLLLREGRGLRLIIQELGFQGAGWQAWALLWLMIQKERHTIDVISKARHGTLFCIIRFVNIMIA